MTGRAVFLVGQLGKRADRGILRNDGSPQAFEGQWFGKDPYVGHSMVSSIDIHRIMGVFGKFCN